MNIEGKRLLIVGAGLGQLPAILAAKKLGIESIVVDKNPDAAGMYLADKSYVVDIVDIPKVLDVAKLEKINGTMTMQSDVGMPTVGALNDAFGLHGVTREVANRCSNKISMRCCFEAADVSQPKFIVVDDIDSAINAVKKLNFPCVFKSPDSSGSRGIVKVSELKDVDAAFKEARKYTSGAELIVEEFIAGIEVGAQAFSDNGRCDLVLIHDDMISPPPYMIPVGHAFPATLDSEVLKTTALACRRSVEALGIEDGPSNIDIIIGHDGVPRIIEVGARIGATCLPELVLYHTGIDWTESAVLSAIGVSPSLIPSKSSACAAFILESPKNGVFRGATFPDSFKSNPDILEWEITAKMGEIVSVLKKGTDRIGKIIVAGQNTSGAIELANTLRKSFTFDIT